MAGVAKTGTATVFAWKVWTLTKIVAAHRAKLTVPGKDSFDHLMEGGGNATPLMHWGTDLDAAFARTRLCQHYERRVQLRLAVGQGFHLTGCANGNFSKKVQWRIDHRPAGMHGKFPGGSQRESILSSPQRPAKGHFCFQPRHCGGHRTAVNPACQRGQAVSYTAVGFAPRSIPFCCDTAGGIVMLSIRPRPEAPRHHWLLCCGQSSQRLPFAFFGPRRPILQGADDGRLHDTAGRP